MPRPNVVNGHGSLTTYLNALPAIAIFIGTVFDKDAFLKSYETFLNTDDEDQNWQLKGTQMNFTIYWEHGGADLSVALPLLYRGTVLESEGVFSKYHLSKLVFLNSPRRLNLFSVIVFKHGLNTITLTHLKIELNKLHQLWQQS